MKIKVYKQKNKLSCGPAALRMVMDFYSVNKSEKEIIKGVGGIKGYGVRTTDLATYARRLGFKVKYYSFNKKLTKDRAEFKKPNPELIKLFLKKRIPIILAVNSKVLYNNFKQSIKGHFIVIIKYQAGVYTYNDPRDGRQHTIKENDLLFTWYNNVLHSGAYLLAIWIHEK